MDATLIAAPKQRNNDGKKTAIKERKTAEEIWPDQPAEAELRYYAMLDESPMAA